MVDRDGLENRCACKRTVGSNPTLSANFLEEVRNFKGLLWSEPRRLPIILPIILPTLAAPGSAGSGAVCFGPVLRDHAPLERLSTAPELQRLCVPLGGSWAGRQATMQRTTPGAAPRPVCRRLQVLSCSARMEWDFANLARSVGASVSQASADAASRKIPQGSICKYFGIELLSLLVEFIGRRDYGDPAHQLVDFVAENTGSNRDQIVLA